MGLNDNAWEIFFRKTKILQRIEHSGFAYVSAKDLKDLTGREPRLLAKQDSLADRPKVFRDNEIAIFPVENGRYILFSDPEQRSFYKFPPAALDLPVQTYNSNVSLDGYDSFPRNRSFSEAQAIDFAYIASLLRKVFGEEHMDLVVRGRLRSGEFDFMLPSYSHRVGVSGVQIEVDAGYESERAIYVIEAKIGRREDFHIRQLYYPFLEWSHRSKKRVVPMFLVYTNSTYYLHEFEFSEEFGKVSLARSESYVINEPPTTDIDLTSLLRTIQIEGEPGVPYPQANDLDKVIDLLSLLDGGVASKGAISESFEFDERQGDYYANAARYLGFADKRGTEYGLTALGQQLLQAMSRAEKTRIIATQLLRRPTFRDALELLASRGFDLGAVSDDELSALIEAGTHLTGATPPRRASTVRSWLKWLLQNGRFVVGSNSAV